MKKTIIVLRFLPIPFPCVLIKYLWKNRQVQCRLLLITFYLSHLVLSLRLFRDKNDFNYDLFGSSIHTYVMFCLNYNIRNMTVPIIISDFLTKFVESLWVPTHQHNGATKQRISGHINLQCAGPVEELCWWHVSHHWCWGYHSRSSWHHWPGK
jgi:hypothetical protein